MNSIRLHYIFNDNMRTINYIDNNNLKEQLNEIANYDYDNTCILLKLNRNILDINNLPIDLHNKIITVSFEKKIYKYLVNNNNNYELYSNQNTGDPYYKLLEYYITQFPYNNENDYNNIVNMSYKNFILNILSRNGALLTLINNEMKNNQDIVLTAVRQCGNALHYASENMKDNNVIVLEAIKHNEYVLSYRINQSPKFMLIFNSCEYSLRYASDRLKDNETIVLEAVKQNGSSLQYASIGMKNNSIIVLEAVKQNGLVLQYASNDKKDYGNIALAAVRQNGLALQYVSTYMKNTKRIVLAAIRQNRLSFQYASNDMQNNPEVLLQYQLLINILYI